jgi:transcriptional regulator with XRE-family HTH domain
MRPPCGDPPRRASGTSPNCRAMIVPICAILSSMTSATIIRNARRRAGLTQVQLAGRMGKSQPEIGRWERGEVQPSFETLQRIVAACGLELVAQTYNADDSYDAHISDMLRLSPRERVEESARQAEAFRRLSPRAV